MGRAESCLRRPKAVKRVSSCAVVTSFPKPKSPKKKLKPARCRQAGRGACRTGLPGKLRWLAPGELLDWQLADMQRAPGEALQQPVESVCLVLRFGLDGALLACLPACFCFASRVIVVVSARTCNLQYTPPTSPCAFQTSVIISPIFNVWPSDLPRFRPFFAISSRQACTRALSLTLPQSYLHGRCPH